MPAPDEFLGDPPSDRQQRGRTLTPRTPFSLGIWPMLSLVGAILTGGFYAGSRLQQLVGRIDKLEYSLVGTVTKEDIRQLKSEMRSMVRDRLGRATVRCPAVVVRGAASIECEFTSSFTSSSRGASWGEQE